MQHEQLAELLFRGFEQGDSEAVRSVCAPDLVARQNDGPAMDLDSLLKFSQAVANVVENFRYEDRVCAATAGGFVEEHSVCGTLPDGSELRLPACVVADVRDGRIVSLREYLDSARATGLLEAL